MADEVVVGIYSIVGSSFCVASDDGQKVFDRVKTLMENGKKIRLSFLNVESLTSAFLNAAIGQLYGKFTEDQIKDGLLPPSNIEPDDLALLKRVVENAKKYFSDPERFDRAKREVIGEGDD
ncbi:STAS-like domain-containing protein [candidate division FCPU426 bacterium]|nr:STAS-like domain-containing protein [candidate division FCPU426 bacterium]